MKQFWDRVEKGDGCWIWIGDTNKKGYGIVRIFSGGIGAHRFSWILAHGEIPDGLFVCHHCDNPPCVRPDHLFLGTASDNMQDALRKNRLSYPKGQPEHLHLIGEKNPISKLTESKVVELRRRHAAGGTTYVGLAKEFGVSPATVRDAVVGNLRRHVK